MYASEDPADGWVWKDDYGWVREEWIRGYIMLMMFIVTANRVESLFCTQEPTHDHQEPTNAGDEAGAVTANRVEGRCSVRRSWPMITRRPPMLAMRLGAGALRFANLVFQGSS